MASEHPPSSRQQSRYPGWAVATGRTSQPTSRRQPPQRVANRDAAILTLLPQLAARIAAGDTSLTRELGAAVGVSAHGQSVSCPHYLPSNRLDWWGAQPWSSGPLTRECPSNPSVSLGGDTLDAFLTEFTPALATIVGADIAADALRPYRRVPWDVSPGSSPNAVPGIGFTVLTRHPDSVPTIQAVEVNGQRRSVLVNAVDSSVVPDPSMPRADLVLDFDVPQRAVGIEYVWLPVGDERRPDVRGITLLALAEDGTDLSELGVQSDGNQLATYDPEHDAPLLEHGQSRFIGIRDEQGRISSVILRYGRQRPGDPDDPRFIAGPQIVYRVWYEPLPGAVVKQDQVEERRDASGTLTSTAQPIALPFNCDRAVAFLRGFRTEFPEVREIWGLDVGVATRVDSAERTVTVLPSGPSGFDLLEAPYTNRMYYTLLAWDSRQVELQTSSASTRLPVVGPSQTPGLQDALLDWWISLFATEAEDVTTFNRGFLDAPDPCPDAPPANVEALRRCGPVAGVLTGFAFEFAETSELDRLLFAAADAARSVPAGRSIVRWPLSATARGDGEEVDLLVRGTIVGGHGLVPVTELSGSIAVTVDPQSDRPDDQFFWTGPDLARSIEADMAFVAIRHFSFQPEDEIRQVDVEVKATTYDGRRLAWAVGGGTVTDDDGSDTHLVYGFPSVIGVVRRSGFGGPRLEMQSVRWTNTAVGTHSGPPAQLGVLRNVGDLVAVIADVHKQGPHADEFRFFFVHRSDVIDEQSLPTRLPLRLRPGESLVVGGFFFPAVTGTREASLLVTTNDRQSLHVALPATGEAISPNPGGALTGHLNFGMVQVNQQYEKRALLEAIGETPLVVQQIRIEHPSIGFSVTQPAGDRQIDPGESWILTVSFRGVAPGVVNSQLIVETNAGQVTKPVRAEVLGPPLPGRAPLRPGDWQHLNDPERWPPR